MNQEINNEKKNDLAIKHNFNKESSDLENFNIKDDEN